MELIWTDGGILPRRPEGMLADEKLGDGSGNGIIMEGTRGTLIADTSAQLEALIDAIDAEVDQAAADLVEDGINTWPGCVMRSFTHAPRHRIGARYAVAYNLVYLQTAV